MHRHSRSSSDAAPDAGGGAWFEAAPAAEPSPESAVGGAGSLRAEAEALTQSALEVYEQQKSAGRLRISSDSKWLDTVLRSGTTSDRVAAMTVLVQEAPLHNAASLTSLLALATKKGNRDARTMACEALRDLFVQNLLPGRQLRFLREQPLSALPPLADAAARSRALRYWRFEDFLKGTYVEFLAVLERDLQDSVATFKLKAMHTAADLLTAKPEQEQLLLSLLVNKLGDADRKVCSRALHLLQQLVLAHGAMKQVVAQNVKASIFANVCSDRSRYYAILFLSSLQLQRPGQDGNGGDAELACELIEAYFELFQLTATTANSSSTMGVQSRIMSAVLTGVNRAFPFAKSRLDTTTVLRHIEALFRLVHKAQMNISVQALMLLVQLQGEESGSGLSDRFYRALFEKVLDPGLAASSKQAMFLNILFRAMKRDSDANRLKAFAKRLLQACSYHKPPFICGALFLLSEVATSTPELSAYLCPAQVQADAAPRTAKKQRARELVIHVTTDDAAAPESSAASATEIERNESLYDVSKRDPRYAHAESSCVWEFAELAQHYHPTVQVFAHSISSGRPLNYRGDPLVDHSLVAFLDRFVDKKPKNREGGTLSVHAGRSRMAVEAQHVSGPELAARSAVSVPVSDVFFRRYFVQKEERLRSLEQGRGAEEDQGGDSSEEDSEADAFAEGEEDELLSLDGDDDMGDSVFAIAD